ncbi:hypothetical protein M3Y94_00579900 [Aphelenchoides besseyi]|nr:hypothetical protein M3Y94_00579900 [Aphelenchoides besseyi]KAI6222016.1 hypothetical protein M3Y95_00939900 [Aphelenchoides besseyi]
MTNWLSRLFNPCKVKRRKAITSGTTKPAQGPDPNVKQLLECEQRCKKIVAEAQERRKKRRVQAKLEAKKEVDLIRGEYEKKFKEKHAADENQMEAMNKEIEAKTQKQLSDITTQVATHKEQVLKFLHDELVNIKPKINRNHEFRSRFHKPKPFPSKSMTTISKTATEG